MPLRLPLKELPVPPESLRLQLEMPMQPRLPLALIDYLVINGTLAALAASTILAALQAPAALAAVAALATKTVPYSAFTNFAES